jgi:hypothetical protein
MDVNLRRHGSIGNMRKHYFGKELKLPSSAMSRRSAHLCDGALAELPVIIEGGDRLRAGMH